MPRTALNDLKLRSLPSPEKGQRDYWDTTLRGFGVRVSQGGTRTFVLNIDNGRRTIGRYGVISLAEARTEAKRILAERTLGHVRPQNISFVQARDLFLQEKQATRRPSTYKGLKRFLYLYFPSRGLLNELTHAEVERRVGRIKAPSEKNHAIAAAKVFFTWCVKKRHLTDNPTVGLSLILSNRIQLRPPFASNSNPLKLGWSGLIHVVHRRAPRPTPRVSSRWRRRPWEVPVHPHG